MSQYRTLVFAILHRAIKDVEEGDMAQAIDAVRFFDGGFFEDMADVVNLDVESTRTMIYDCFRERCRHWYWQAGKDYRIKSKDCTVLHSLA